MPESELYFSLEGAYILCASEHDVLYATAVNGPVVVKLYCDYTTPCKREYGNYCMSILWKYEPLKVSIASMGSFLVDATSAFKYTCHSPTVHIQHDAKYVEDESDPQYAGSIHVVFKVYIWTKTIYR